MSQNNHDTSSFLHKQRDRVVFQTPMDRGKSFILRRTSREKLRVHENGEKEEGRKLEEKEEEKRETSQESMKSLEHSSFSIAIQRRHGYAASCAAELRRFDRIFADTARISPLEAQLERHLAKSRFDRFIFGNYA